MFSEGINEKDSISALALLRNSDAHFLGNIILGTELQRLYILDSYGHSIISRRIVGFTPSIILGYGSVADKYTVLVMGREGEMCIYLSKDEDEPSERIRNDVRIVSACLSFPDVLVVGADQTVGHYVLSNSNSKLMGKKYTLKLGQQPLKAEFLRFKGQKMSIVALEGEVRLYSERELQYTFVTEFKLYNVVWGSFAREECCLILLYENAGFEVLILHRQFSPKEKYGSNKALRQEYESIPIPKKTNHFLAYWEDDEDEALLYKHFERSLQLLRWRTLREKFAEGTTNSQDKLQVNAKVLGLGPVFNLQVEVENVSKEVIFGVGVMVNYEREKVRVVSSEHRISMIAPFTPTPIEIQVESVSLKNESVVVEIVEGSTVVSTIVYIPNCEEFANY